MVISSTKRIWLCVLLCWTVLGFAESPDSFKKAKRQAGKIFSAQRETLYCGCAYDANNQIDLASCNMLTASHIKRARHIEWEHMMAAEYFGRQFPCWHQALCSREGKPYKGRKCCEKIDKQYNHTAGELYNLWPAVGLINQIRSNYAFSELPKRHPTYGCDFTVDKLYRRVEPTDAAKGIVARANLFMADHYAIPISTKERKQFLSWHKQFPASDWEKEWAAKVAKIEGYRNPLIPEVVIADGNS